jgi:hypothetical protein
LTGNIVATAGQYITQANTTANAKIISISANATGVTVGNLTSNFQRRGGNIYVNGVDSKLRPVFVNNIFDYTKYSALTADWFTTAADRIMTYYEPTTNMPGKDLSQVMNGIDYPGVNLTGVAFDADTSVLNSNLIYTDSHSRSIYSANITIPSVALTVNTAVTVYTGNIISQATTGANGVVYATSSGNIITLVDVFGTFSTTGGYALTSNSIPLAANVQNESPYEQVTTQNIVDFTQYNYQAGEPITLVDTDTNTSYELTLDEVDTWKIVVGGNVPTIPVGANLALKYYDYNNPTYLDSSIQNTYTTTSITSIIDGGAYYDAYSSHAPEELVPGVTYDSLKISVYTGMTGLAAGVGLPLGANLTAQNYTANIGYRIIQNMNGNAASGIASQTPTYYGISASHNTTLLANLNITDANIYVTNANVLTWPNSVTNVPGVVYIDGEKIVFWGVDPNNNVLTNIRRAVDGTGAPLVHVAGMEVIDTNVAELIPTSSSEDVHLTDWLNPPIGAPMQFIFYDNTGAPYDWVDESGDLMETIGQQGSAVTDGTELQGSQTIQAFFLRNLA